MPAPLIQIDHISKRFGGVAALTEVSFSVEPGEVHAIVGENGAGKSTLMKILAGVHEPDSGKIVLRGAPTRLRSPIDARRQGISIVFQELNLFPTRSIAANLFANRERRNAVGFLDRRGMRESSREILASVGVIAHPDTPVGRLSIGERQLVEIARALDQQSDIVILDEPNSALGVEETRRLFEIVRRLRETRGVTFLYVSHRLEEVFSVADRVTVIRDGRYQGTQRISETTIPQVIERMVGRTVVATESPPPLTESQVQEPPALHVRGLRGGKGTRAFGPVSFEVRPGEILGFAGLEGSGVDPLFQALFGLMRPENGEVMVHGQAHRPTSARRAIDSKVALVPASRREQGLFMGWSVWRNAILLILDELSPLGLISGGKARGLAARHLGRTNFAVDRLKANVGQLSGGNQQKVLLAKWLATWPRVLIVNDPTRGVDVGAKDEIYRMCKTIAAEGVAILLYSSELEETLALSHRILVFRRGEVAHEFTHGTATKKTLTHWISGGARQEGNDSNKAATNA